MDQLLVGLMLLLVVIVVMAFRYKKENFSLADVQSGLVDVISKVQTCKEKTDCAPNKNCVVGVCV